MVVEVPNPVNSYMHYGDRDPVVSVIDAPDYMPKRIWYSNNEANKTYNELQHDIYQTAKQTKKPKKGKFPTVLKIVGAGIVVGLAIVFRKDIGALLKKINPFKKSAPTP